jgi:hypothetical protein
MSPDQPVVLRCATIVFRDGEVFVVRRCAWADLLVHTAGGEEVSA